MQVFEQGKLIQMVMFEKGFGKKFAVKNRSGKAASVACTTCRINLMTTFSNCQKCII